MIFVTVGTHEQPFDRLIKTVDELKSDGTLTEDVIIQTGYCNYVPKFCTYQKFFSYNEMIQMVEKARVVITHGGPSSFIMPLQMGKIPIVVPRQKKYNEHVNDHQVDFCEKIEALKGNIIVIRNMEELGRIIETYSVIIEKMDNSITNNTELFNEKVRNVVDDLFSR